MRQEKIHISDKDLFDRAAIALNHSGDKDYSELVIQRYEALNKSIIELNQLITKLSLQVEAIPTVVKPYFKNNSIDNAMILLEDLCKNPLLRWGIKEGK